jgi:hypothetical protein
MYLKNEVYNLSKLNVVLMVVVLVVVLVVVVLVVVFNQLEKVNN